MKLIHNVVVFATVGLLGGSLWAQNVPSSMPSSSSSESLKNFDVQTDAPGSIDFFGSDTAVLFSKEVSESFKGVLAHDYVSNPDGGFPPGFLNASPQSQPWYGTMWTRDAGTFMREMVLWGYYEHACQVAQCAMDFVGTDTNGFVAF